MAFLDEEREEVKKMIKESLAEGFEASKPEFIEGVKTAILGAQDGKRLTKEQIMAVKSRSERQKLINENMDLFQ